MAEKTRIVGSDDKGQFNVPVPRGSIERVDIIDLDMVLQTKDGSRLILPGAAIDAMSAKPPSVSFPDGRIGAADLLSSVGKVETPPSSIPAMTSLTQFDQKLTQGKKNRTDDANDKQAEEAQAQQVAPLPVGAGQSSVDDLMKKAEKLLDETRNKAFDPAPAQIHQTPAQTSDAPGSQPQTAKIPLYISLAEGNVVGITTTAVSDTLTVGGVTRTYTTAISGSGGPSGSGVASGIQPTDALQYGTETLTGTSGNDVIYADGFAGLGGYRNTQATYADLNVDTGMPNSAGTHFYYAKEITLTLAGYIRTINSITISGLPAGVVALVIGGTAYGVSGGSISIPSSAVVPNAQSMTLIYDLSAVTNGVYDIKVNISGRAVDEINVTRTFKLQLEAVAAAADITGNSPVYIPGSGWTDYYVLETASSPHTIDAGAGDDLVYGGNSADTVTGGDGNDIILTYAGNDTILGGNGDDIVWAGNGNDIVLTGADTSSNTNTVYGGNGDDTLIGGSGNDSLYGGAGNDILYGGTGTNILDAGDGTGDWVSFNGTTTITAATASLQSLLALAGELTSVTITLDANGNGTATQSSGSATLSGVENIIGTGGNDSINASAYAVSHTLYGLAGDDVIIGGAAADTIYGGAGRDSILGNGGDDLINLAVTDVTIDGSGLSGTTADIAETGGMSKTVSNVTAGITQTFTDITNYADGGAGADTIYGGAGNDLFIATYGETVNGSNTDWFYGGGGTDTVDFTTFTSGLTIDMAGGSASVSGSVYARFSSVERILTGSGDDTVTGTAENESIWTGAGNDTVRSGDGADYIDLGNGTNWADAGAGNDTVYGGSGSDTINSGAGNDTVYGGVGNDTLYANSGNDSLYGGNDNDLLVGSTTATDIVVMDGGTGTNTYYANVGIDSIVGSSGTDWVRYDFYSTLGTNVSGTNYGVFVNLDGTTSYGVAADGTLVAGATSSNWWNGTTGVDMTTTSVSGKTWAWNATNAGTGFYGYANGDSYTAVENISGTGNSDVLIGNSLNNTFQATSGNDAMYGLGGDDTFSLTNSSGNRYIDGGSGIDTLNFSGITGSTPVIVDLSTNTMSMTGVAGTSKVYNIENITGGAGDDILTGDANANTINGGLGADTMTGGSGDDYYYVNSSSDKIFENFNEGTDTVYATYSYTLGANLENLVAGAANLTLTGNELANTITGSTGVDILYGMDGDDTLIGNGGADSLYGGNGNDTIITTSAIAGNTNIAYSFDGGAGTDTLTAANWTLSNLSVSKLSSIEVLDLRGATNITTSALNVTNIAGILDSAAGNTLTIYLDSGDTFTTTNANVTTSAANDGQGHTGTHYTYTSGSTTYYVDVYKV